MARDKNEEVPHLTGYVDDPDTWPTQGLPLGVERDGSKFYAHRRTYADGRTVWQFFARKTSPVAGQPDRVIGELTTVNTKIQDDFKKEEEKSEAKTEREQNQSERKRVSVTFEGEGANRKRRTTYESGPDLVEDAPETTATSPSAQRTAREEAEIAVNAALPPDQDPRSETNKERAERGERVIKEQKAEADRQAAANKPTTVATNTTEPYIVERMPDGSLRSSPNPNYKGPEQKPGSTLQVKGGDGKTYLVPVDASGKPGTPTAIDVPGQGPVTGEVRAPVKDHPNWTEVTAEVKQSDGSTKRETYYLDPQGQRQNSLPDKLNIKGVPPYTPDLTKPGAGIIDRAKELDQLVQAGTITWDQRNRVLQQDQVLTQSIANEFNVGVSILREDYQNQVSQRNVDVNNAQHRASLANSHMQNAIGLVSKFMPYLGQTPGDAGKLFTGMMAAQLATATAYGGMQNFPREQMSPGIKSWAERATSGAAAPPAIGTGNVPSAVPSAPSVPQAEARPPMAMPAVPAAGISDTMDAGGVPREFTPSSATTPGAEPIGAAVPHANPAIAALFGQTMPAPRPPEEDSWRQQAMNRRDLMLGQQLAGSALPEIPEAAGLDLNASMGPMLSPVLRSAVQGLTPEMDQMARDELDMEWLS